MMKPEDIAAENEASHQSALFAWANEVKDQYPELRRMFAIANGGHRTKSQAGSLRAQGVKRGVPDIFLPVKRGMYLGLFIELKKLKLKIRTKNIHIQEQNEWIDYLKAQGYGAIMCRGWIEARDIIVQYMEWK